MLFYLILALKLPFIKESSNTQDDVYEKITYELATGKFADSNYHGLHRINRESFTIDSTGDRGGNPIANAFDDNSNSYWVSDKPENDTFHPSIFITFSSTTLFEGFTYKAAMRKLSELKHFDGFPGKLKVYSAMTENDPYVLRAIFSGSQRNTDDNIQFVLSNPIRCTRIKLEFHDISVADSLQSNQKLAAVCNLVLFQIFDHDVQYHSTANGFYANDNYIDSHKIADLSVSTNGDKDGYPNGYFLDSDPNSKWMSKEPQSDTYTPTIIVNFAEPQTFEGFIYYVSSHKYMSKRYYDGFPSRIHFYTAQGEDDPFTLHTIFSGEQKDTTVQFILSKPVNCSRIKLELFEVGQNRNGDNWNKEIGTYASCDQLIFLRTIKYQVYDYQAATGRYTEQSYLHLNKITESIGRVYTNGDDPTNPISKALDDNSDTYWQAEKEESSEFHPTIFVDFNEPTLFEALVYDVKSKSGNPRTYYGYPYQILVYAALKEDEELTPKLMFQGTPMDPHLQLVLPEPIKCTKLKFEFYYVANTENGGKIAQADGLHFIVKRPYEVRDYEKAQGNYANAEYLKLFDVQKYGATITTNGDDINNPIENALDDDVNSFWQAKEAESDNFHPTIFVNFKEPTLFDALVYDVKSEKGNPRKYYGYPSQILIYTALENDEPLTPKVLFQGSPMDPHLQLVMSEPINCTKIKFEFHYVANIKDGDKIAQADGLHFLQKCPYEVKYYEKAEGNYANAEYQNFHSVTQAGATITTNGDDTQFPIDYALDDNVNSYWQAKEAESDNFHPTIFVNFKEPTLFDALVYDVKSEKGNPRKYYGYPSQILIYTALENDEPLTPKVLFQGSPMDPHLQLVMSEPINCTKMKFEFHYVANIKDGDKIAQADGLHFLQSFEADSVSFGPLSGIYNDNAYVNFHTCPQENFILSSNSEKADHPISDALSEDYGKYWVSDKDISNDFKPSIYANFSEPVLLEGFIIDATYKTIEKDKLFNYAGFPMSLNIYTSVKNGPFVLKTKFVEMPLQQWKPVIQFIFPSPIRCESLQIEFVQVTKNSFINDEPKASITRIRFLTQEHVEYNSGTNITADQEVIYVKEEYYLDEVIDTNFVNYYLPRGDNYLFVVEKKFLFQNDEFLCEEHKVGAIRSISSPQITIDNCKFHSCTVKVDETNGGAINFINCGISCTSSQFSSCTSTTGGKGGAIYLRIDSSSVQGDAIIKGCDFTECSAYYGGGAFVYSNDASKQIKIMNCQFSKNEALSSSSLIDPSSGSALYLMTQNSIVIRCRFSQNKGKNSVNIVYNFGDELKNVKHSLSKSSPITIQECEFIIDKSEESSLSLRFDSSLNLPVSVKKCIFDGKPSGGAQHIHAESRKNGVAPHIDAVLKIESCKFSDGVKKAVGMDNVIGTMSMKTKRNENGGVVVLTAVAVSGMLVIAAIVALIVVVRKRTTNEEDEN